MMFGGSFGLPGFYQYPSGYYYPDYDIYGGYESNYKVLQPRGCPLTEMSPEMRHRYGMPVEIPIMHEGSNVTSPAEKETEAKKPRQHEDAKSLIKETQEKKQSSSPRQQQKRNAPKPCAAKQVPMSEMKCSDAINDDFSFFPRSSVGMFEDGFPFPSYYPQSRRANGNLHSSKASSQKTAAKEESKIPVEKTTTPKTPAKGTPKDTTAEATTVNQEPYNTRTVPIAMEHSTKNTCPTRPQTPQPVKCNLTPIEQLDNIEKEMEAIQSRVENFSGEKTDKEYIVLDETMTSLLLKLDMIESNGIEEIRNRRRQLVRCIQEYVEKLENKVGVAATTEGKMNAEEMEKMGSEEMEEESEANQDGDGADVEIASEQSDSEQPQHLTVTQPEKSCTVDEKEQKIDTEGKLLETTCSSPKLGGVDGAMDTKDQTIESDS